MKPQPRKALVATGLLLLLGAAPAFATDHLVPAGASIQAAIDIAVDGDRVLVEPGIYQEQLDYEGKAIEVIGVGGPLVTVLEGAGLEGPGVKFWLGEGPGSVLRAFTVRNWHNPSNPYSSHGGGISARDNSPSGSPVGTPTVESCIIADCSAGWGGGAFTNGLLRRCVLVGNGTASITFGGGVAGESPVVVECVLAYNDAYEGGGAFRRWGSGTAVFHDCVIVENRAGEGASGAGLELSGPTLVKNCLIARNAITWGGMIGNQGSGVHAFGPGILLDSCTIADNTCTPSFFGPNAGGVVGPATLVGCIVRGNCEIELQQVTATYSDVLGGWSGTGNFDQDPLFVDAAAGDYHLRAGSPCIGAGDPLAFDPDGTAADVGAHFYQTLYVRDNATAAQWADPAWSSIPGLSGGKASWRVHAGAASAGQLYGLAGSLSGTAPGIPLLGVTLPLVPDGYFLFTVNHANQPPFTSSLGFLDAAGNGDATFTLPSGHPELLGVTAWHAAVVVDLAIPAATLATNAVAMAIE